jgi:tRNA nucleotidyltransferase (CCA-adding enzyme)
MNDIIIGRDHAKILFKVLEQIKPTPKEEEEDRHFIEEFLRRLDEITPKNVEVQLAGSTAHGTNLRGDRDFDVFLLFPKSYSVKDLEILGLQWAKKAIGKGKWEIAYAEHPYLHGFLEGREIDIVPAYKITEISERATAVDRSPLHSAYLMKKLSESQKDDVRLLKKFLKAAGIYGAEGKIMGFSGYLCELLIISHGDFLTLIDAAANSWRNPVFDIEYNQPVDELRKKFPDAAMIFIDPVDSHRNVAAAVSKTSLSIFIHTARRFLENPSLRFFIPPTMKVDLKWMKKQIVMRDSAIYAIEFEKPKVVEDILWPQLYKFAAKISERAREQDFSVFDTEVWEKDNKCIVLFEFEIFNLPRLKKVIGPPLWMKKEVEEFMKKHKVMEPIWFEKERILALGKRKFLSAKDFLIDVIKRPGPYGTPPDIEKIIKRRGAKLIEVNDIVKKYTEYLHGYLKKRNIP